MNRQGVGFGNLLINEVNSKRFTTRDCTCQCLSVRRSIRDQEPCPKSSEETVPRLIGKSGKAHLKRNSLCLLDAISGGGGGGARRTYILLLTKLTQFKIRVDTIKRSRRTSAIIEKLKRMALKNVAKLLRVGDNDQQRICMTKKVL